MFVGKQQMRIYRIDNDSRQQWADGGPPLASRYHIINYLAVDDIWINSNITNATPHDDVINA